MNGVNVAVACHTVNVIPPQSLSGGITGQAFSMKGAEHVSIIINLGATTSPPTIPTSIQVNLCTSAAGAGATAMPNGFRYYYQTAGGAGNDILNGNQQAQTNTPSQPPNYTIGAAGIVGFPSPCTNLVYIIEIDAAEVEVLADVVGTIVEYPYLQVVIANGANAIYGSVIAVLSGLRYAYNVGASATV